MGRIEEAVAVLSKNRIVEATRIASVDRTHQDALTKKFHLHRAVGRAVLDLARAERLPFVVGGDFNELPPGAANTAGRQGIASGPSWLSVDAPVVGRGCCADARASPSRSRSCSRRRRPPPPSRSPRTTLRPCCRRAAHRPASSIRSATASPTAIVRWAAVRSDVSLTGEYGLSVPTMPMHYLQGYVFPSWEPAAGRTDGPSFPASASSLSTRGLRSQVGVGYDRALADWLRVRGLHRRRRAARCAGAPPGRRRPPPTSTRTARW